MEKQHRASLWYVCICMDWCFSLAVAGNKSATWPPLPPLGCGGVWKETGKLREQ